jgi:hypothetical protein
LLQKGLVDSIKAWPVWIIGIEFILVVII